jgi:hypothetical protein
MAIFHPQQGHIILARGPQLCTHTHTHTHTQPHTHAHTHARTHTHTYKTKKKIGSKMVNSKAERIERATSK